MNKEYNKVIPKVLKKLEQGVKEIFTSENYLNYLKFFSKFHNYSSNNVIMILMQYPAASRVASLKTWNKLGLKIKRGSKGIKILVPIPYSYTKNKVATDEFNNIKYDKDGNKIVEETEINGITFRLGNVFDISQVEGEVPKLAHELQANPKHLAEILETLISTSTIPIKYNYSLNNKTAHSILHNEKQNKYSREEAEIQAESIAFVVCNCLGFDTSNYSFGYIASWSKNKQIKELKESLNIIANTSNEILKWIEESTT